MTTAPGRLTRTAAALAVLLALTGCGDDGGSGDSTDSADRADSDGGDAPGFGSPLGAGDDETTESGDPSPAPSAEPPSPSSEAPAPTPTEPPAGPSVPEPTGPVVDLTRPPATYDAALQHLRAAERVAEAGRFETPSRNLYCVVAADGLPAACELAEGAVRDVAYCGADAPSILVGRVELADGVATAVCNTDTIRSGRVPVIDYGTLVTSGGSPVLCVVAQIGVTCVDTTASQGFFLARDNYLLLTD